MVALMSEKSRLISPGVTMMSLIPCTAWRSRSSAILKDSKKLVPRGTRLSRRSLGIAITVSTVDASRPRPSSARRMRRGPSKPNGLVTTATVSASSSLASDATTGAAPVPVPPPRPAVTKTMSAPCSSSTIRSVFSSAAWRPISGFEPAPRPLVIFAPSCSLLGTSHAFSAWMSVFMAQNSTPSRPSATMRATALQPPPPTPITLMRVPVRASSSRVYFRSSESESMTPTRCLPASSAWHLFENSSQPRRILALILGLFLELGRVHGQPSHRAPLRIVQLLRPVLNTLGETEAGLALENFFGGVAQAGHSGAGPCKKDSADQRAVHPHAREFAAHETEQLVGAGFDNPVHDLALHLASPPVFERGQLDEDVVRAVGGQRAAELHLDHLRFFKAQAEALGQVAGEMIAAHAHRRSQVHGVAVIDDQFGGFGPDVHHRDPLAPVLGKHRRVARGERFEDRFLHGEMRFVDRTDDRVVFLHRRRDDVNVDFQPRRQHVARIAVPGMVVDHEILREDLQHHAVFHELHAGRPVDHAIDVALLNLARETQFQHAAAIGAAQRRTAHPHHRRANIGLGADFGFVQRGQHARGHGFLIGDAPLQPSLGLGGRRAQETNTAAFQDADHHARLVAAGVESYGVDRFYCHFLGSIPSL